MREYQQMMKEIANLKGKSASYMTSWISNLGGGNMATGFQRVLDFTVEDTKRTVGPRTFVAGLAIGGAVVFVGQSAYNSIRQYIAEGKKHQKEGKDILNTLKQDQPTESDNLPDSSEETPNDADSPDQDGKEET